MEISGYWTPLSTSYKHYVMPSIFSGKQDSHNMLLFIHNTHEDSVVSVSGMLAGLCEDLG